MSDISESVIQEIRNLHGPDADEILSAMQQDDGEERRRKQREAEEYLINKAYEESLKEAKVKQTAVLTRAQISESVMGAVLDAAGGDRVQAAKLMEEFQRPSGRKDTQRTVDESTIIKKILEESEKAELERQRRLVEEERKVAMAMRVAIEKSKEETQTKARQERAAMEAELARMKKQLQEDAQRLADEKAQLAARREAELKKREEEAARAEAERARVEAERTKREEERRRAERDKEIARELERERAKQAKAEEEKVARQLDAELRAARLAKEKAETERRQQQEHQRAREEALAAAEAAQKDQKAREEALSRELQQREHQLKARERSSPRVQDWISQSVLGPPKVSIYTQGGTALSVSEIKTFLMSVDPTLKESEIFAHEFTHDYELANFIKEKCPHDTFPVVCIHGTPIGDLATLKLNRQHIPALLRGEMLELPSQQRKDVTASLGVLDSALNVGEYVLSGVGSLLSLPVKILAWPFSSKTTEAKTEAEEPEFQCIHQNWYYRNLVRVFRFREKDFVRVHPTHKDVRAQHEYSTISVVTLTDAENMIINYNDGSAPDYIKASETDIKEMIRLIKTRSPKDIQVVVESA